MSNKPTHYLLEHGDFFTVMFSFAKSRAEAAGLRMNLHHFETGQSKDVYSTIERI